MARKKKPPEHENLERWLVSYADFITLLFATFVVLYALSQSDISKFEEVEQSMKRAFSHGKMDGDSGLLDNVGSSILSSGSNGFNLLAPMLEKMESNYEEKAFGEVKHSIEKLKKKHDFDGIDVNVDERGLSISVVDNLVFQSGSAKIKPTAVPMISKIGNIIAEKFPVNFIRVEGHTDTVPIKSMIYPSNWELSSARASEVVRFFIKKFELKPNRFAAIGYSSSRPVESNATVKGRSKNRRVEIIVLRIKSSKGEPKVVGIDKERLDRLKVLKKKQETSISNFNKRSREPQVSDAVKKMMNDTGVSQKDVILIKDDRLHNDSLIKKQIQQMEKPKETLKLPDPQKKKKRHLSDKEKKIINQLRSKGKVNDAVADLLNDRGTTSNAIIITEH